nr:RecName: Full=Pyrokinin-4; Short=Pea-PK-4; AltName: Full=YXPRL-amide [Periplaneta americana]P84409.1 RecName: Full=Pyrokinin-4; AltName: Full=YXPRL-amide [Periplaneta australasiae]P84410.1 RecName: Full=Pyrokinin-4; AltName: Full=YXPRL-amide [Blatta orientalis]P84411.1 RecName: Full=Pyrokinin-4; AltName: Full=YXPRL-amide [Periplaneta lateralis]P84412.1 RecName: Full=Pyrokinin-4; AltName: Full=YXPRL-amide [Neostylopyga rhombifolia]P84413.1 RecName: Full=Pyrokinin-4; AltName: Full=YXPRL-amide
DHLPHDVYSPRL